jgi:hypothetical protein
MDHALSVFARYQTWLMGAMVLFVLSLILSHATLPTAYIWGIAAFFSIAMNFTYLTDAVWQGRRVGTEATVMIALIIASLLGIVLHPLFVIAAVFGHGLWDLAKHYGAGLPFFSWYTWGVLRG